MTVDRTYPQFGKTNSSPKSVDDPMGCVWGLIMIIVSYFVLSAIVRTTSNTGSKLDQIICYGALIFCAIIFLWGMRDMYRDSKARAAEKQLWKKACNIAELPIVERHEGGRGEDGYGNYHSWPCRVGLEMNADQRAISPGSTIVSVEVGDYVYKNLAKQETVRIYYKPEAPLTFLLEEE